MDTVGYSMSATVPALAGMPHYNSDGYGSHLYVPWWLSDKHKDLNFPRGYHIEVGGGYGMPGIGSFLGTVNRVEGYGIPMKQAIRDNYGTSIGLSGRGEMIPNEQSYCEIDPDVKDKWGIPVLRFHWGWSDHELNQVRHMQETFRAILETMGGQIAPVGGRGGGRGAATPMDAATPPGQRAGNAPAAEPARPPISRGGAIIHEVGTVRMGNDPRTSPLNKFSQAHDVSNLFVVGSSVFPTEGTANPTLTLAALALRTADVLRRNLSRLPVV